MSHEPTTEVRLKYIFNFADRMIAQLPFQFRYKPNFRALVSALAAGAQQLEDICFDVLFSTTLDRALDDALAQWGDTVLEVKGGLLDSDYRNIILGRVAANKNGGTRDEWIVLYQTLTGSPVRYTDHYPAAIQIVAFPTEPLPDNYARRISRTMGRGKSMGIALELVEAPPSAFKLDTPGFGLDGGQLGRILP